MKLHIRYATKERKYISDFAYQNVEKPAELEPVNIIRYSCGPNRFYYQADFYAPADAEFVNNGMIRQAINRKLNPTFKPKKLHFEGNRCVLPNVELTGRGTES